MTDKASRRGRPVHVVCWSGIALATVAADYAVGPVIQFPALFIIPVSLAAWYTGRRWGLALAVLLPLLRLYFTTLFDVPWTFLESAINAAIRTLVLGCFAWLVDRVAVQSQALRHRVVLMERILPLCAVCKRIRDESARWGPLETYVLERARDQFTPQVCPDCVSRYRESLDRR